jgi:hypothetical protein
MATCPPFKGVINTIGLNPIGIILPVFPAINIWIDWGSSGSPYYLGNWYAGIALLADPGIGDDHTVTFNFPPELTGGTPPSMLFNSVNYYLQQYLSFTIISGGNISIGYTITSISGRVYNGTINFTV